jgi:hypothetical protein
MKFENGRASQSVKNPQIELFGFVMQFPDIVPFFKVWLSFPDFPRCDGCSNSRSPPFIADSVQGTMPYV